MTEIVKPRPRAVQERTLAARRKIGNGAIRVLADLGVEGLTHRAAAEAAGVSLAATTYHFASKAAIIEEASRTLLDGYLATFRRLADRIVAGEEKRIASLDQLVVRVVVNALGRESTRSLAWSELMLHGGRNTAGRALAQRWYRELDVIWSEIGAMVEAPDDTRSAGLAIDLAVGLIFFLQPLGIDEKAVAALLNGQRDPEALLMRLARRYAPPAGETPRPARYAETRQKIVDAAIGIIIDEGATGVSYGSVAKAAGMVRSGPLYYFGTIDALVETAQMALFERAKSRYREGLASAHTSAMNEARLLDLTTAIFYREALEFGRENIGHYSVWMRAAQNPALRPAVAASLLDLHRAWLRRLASVSGTEPTPAAAMRIQALFIGKVIRAIASSSEIIDLSTARSDFASVLRS